METSASVLSTTNYESFNLIHNLCICGCHSIAQMGASRHQNSVTNVSIADNFILESSVPCVVKEILNQGNN